MIITNPTWVDLVSRATLSHGVAAIVTIWAKEGFYHNQYLTNAFFSPCHRGFGCLHQQGDDFLHVPT
jgi:hypothetical protein